MKDLDETFEITVNGAIDIANVMTYDYYARVKRRYMRAGINRRPTFEEYLEECHKYLDMDMMPREAWECGYYFIADLFDDNEASGTACDKEAIFQRNSMETLNMFNKRR